MRGQKREKAEFNYKKRLWKKVKSEKKLYSYNSRTVYDVPTDLISVQLVSRDNQSVSLYLGQLLIKTLETETTLQLCLPFFLSILITTQLHFKDGAQRDIKLKLNCMF